MNQSGRFFIVNVGAGEKDNITVKGLRVLQSADLVIASSGLREQFADELAGKDVIDGGHGLFTDLAHRRLSEAEAAAQETAMRDRLEAAWLAGKTIVLIESGDIAFFSPYRGFLNAFAHFSPQLIAGVSSVNAANALLAQPILDDQAQRFQLTGLQAIMQASSRETLPDTWMLFCMGLDLPALIAKIQALYPAETSMAFVLNAGYPDHEVLRCTVAQAGQFAGRDVAFPRCIIYIGLPVREEP